MPGERILILGGTGEARNIAAALIGEGYAPITSLAGVTENPVLPPGEVRRGGFGGVDGLAAYLADEKIAAVVDATHPFAAQMSAQAHEACGRIGLPLFRLERPAWEPASGDCWIGAASTSEAAALLPAGARALVTIGRKEIAPFFARPDVSGVARMIEPPLGKAPPGWQVVLERPPFTRESETALMTENGITHLVTKNAGGGATEAKLCAARQLSLPVVMIARPAKPGASHFASEGAVVGAIRRVLSP